MRVTLASAVGAMARILSAAVVCFVLRGSSALANTSSPPVLGIDVYGGNGTMNWSQIASSGIQFAWAKASQGNYYQDAQLPNNESNGTGNGVYIGAYDFADPTACSPLTEATYFVNYASQHGAFNTGKLLPALDMESVGTSINGAPNLTTWINNWATDVYNLSGVHPLLYCSPGFFNGHGITSTGVPLWEADWTYPSNLSNTGPPSNSWSPWSTWTFWQYSDKGSVGGDPSTVDLDAYNGNRSQMVANEVIPALAWTGNTNGTWNTTSSGTQNWNYGTTSSNAAYYFDGRALVFQDTNLVKNSQVANSSISIASTVTPQSIAFTANNVNYTFIGVAIAGAGGMTLNGTGTVTLNNGTSAGPNTFSGAVVINKGQLVLEQAWSLGNAPSATVAGGGAIALTNVSGGATTFGNLASGGGTIPLTIAGAGLTASPAGAINSTRGNNTYRGAVSLSVNATINSASNVSGDGLSLPGGIATNGHTLTFSGAGATTVSGAIGGGALTMAGAGTVTLSTANTLSGAVQINSGTLKITNGSALGAGPVTLGGGKLTFAAPAIIGNSVSVSSNSTIDVTGVNSATMGALSIGANTLSVTGGSTGAGARYNLTLGAAILAGNPTFDIANNGAGTGTLALTSLSDGGSSRIITKSNSGTLEVQGASHLSTGTALHVNAGTLRFNNTSGPATIGAVVTATVSGTATLELAGTISALSSSAGPANRANISNISTASAGLLVSGTNQQVGNIDGNGTTQVNAGGSLIANHIVQNALVIGGGSGTSAVVTIDASDPSGNPLAVNSIEPRTSETIPAGPLAPHDLFRAGINSSALVGATANFGLSAAPSGPGSSSTTAGAPVVPEPSSLILLAVAGLALVRTFIRSAQKGDRSS